MENVYGLWSKIWDNKKARNVFKKTQKRKLSNFIKVRIRLTKCSIWMGNGRFKGGGGTVDFIANLVEVFVDVS